MKSLLNTMKIDKTVHLTTIMFILIGIFWNAEVSIQMFFGFFSFIVFILNAFVIINFLRPSNMVETILLGYIFVTAQIILGGFVLSYFNRIGLMQYWSIFSLLVLSISYFFIYRRERQLILPVWQHIPRFSIKGYLIDLYADLSLFQKTILSILIVTALSVNLALALEIIFTTPHNLDVLSYHLARVAYYIQHGNLNTFNANYWAQEQLPKNSSILLLYTYLISGRNENMTQAVQYISYWVSILSIYGICRNLKIGKAGCLFSALSFAIMIEMLMEAITAQNDMILAAYTGCIVYFLISIRNDYRYRHYIYIGICTGIAIGVKSSFFLTIPSLTLIAITTIVNYREKMVSIKRLILLFCSIISFTLLFALPSGYYENSQKYGHPLGEKKIREVHSFAGKSISEILDYGTKNLLRYSIDFISLDGMPSAAFPEIIEINHFIRNIPGYLLDYCDIDLDSPKELVRTWFKYHKPPLSHEDFSYWGILGFGLILPYLLVSLFNRSRVKTEIRILAISFVVFLMSQSYSSPYDFWRGRYFIAAGIFAIPLIGYLFSEINKKKYLIRSYLIIVIVLASISAVSGILFRNSNQIIPDKNQMLHAEMIQEGFSKQLPVNKKSIFLLSRLEQLIRIEPGRYELLKNFEDIVPKNATVGLFVREGFLEYPFFGERLIRTIIPVRYRKRIPQNIDYLVFQSIFLNVKKSDIPLGYNTYLRKM